MVRYSLMLSILNEMIWIFLVQSKGGLISESLSLWLKSQKIEAKSLSLFLDELRSGEYLAPIFGGLS